MTMTISREAMDALRKFQTYMAVHGMHSYGQLLDLCTVVDPASTPALREVTEEDARLFARGMYGYEQWNKHLVDAWIPTIRQELESFRQRLMQP